MQGQIWDDLVLCYLINAKVLILAFYIYLIISGVTSKVFHEDGKTNILNTNHLQYEDLKGFSVFTVSKCQFFKIFLAYLQSKNFKIVSQ